MNKFKNNSWCSLCAVLLVSAYLTGCSNSSSTALASYSVKIVNATNNQPLSPVAVVAHNENYNIWTLGSAATTELEYIAEGGSNSQLIASLANTDTATASGVGAIGPGASETINVTTSATTQTEISLATMLVNTNDAFTGINAVDVSSLAVGDSMTMTANIYDAGTEANSEATGTMPGPVEMGTGEGFNAARSDIQDVVSLHTGVVTADDGLATSVLNQSHRFDNPGILVTITRI